MHRVASSHYQPTCVGCCAPVYTSREVANNQFGVAGGKASWQVTGIRQDSWANANRIPVEREKPKRRSGAIASTRNCLERPPRGMCCLPCIPT